MKMNIKPLHKHYLLFDNYYEIQERCDQCNEQINGEALTCERCKFWLHQSCAEQQLPPQISHPLHPQHFLYMYWDQINHFMCSKCFNLSLGCRCCCTSCSFNLDLLCASSTNGETPKGEISKRSKEIGKTIRHFCHDKPLTLVNYRKVRKDEYCCSWCEKPLSGLSYISLSHCYIDFLIHESCLTKIPSKILDHPLHPSHPLFIHNHPIPKFCNACGNEGRHYKYYCHRCDFNLEVLCSKLKPTLKHYCHNHPLTYFRRGNFQCNKCNFHSYVGDHGYYTAYYRCLQCNFNIHVECLIPSSIKHKYHRHPLTLIDLFKEDDSAEHYCDICEEFRNPQNHVYCCKECTYIAHIECALDMLVDTEFDHGSTSSFKHEETQPNDVKIGSHPQIAHFFHEHPLSFKRVIQTEKDEKLYCEACLRKISDDEAYVCEESCKYYLHKTCAELPFELNLHFHNHPLILMNRCPFTEVFLEYKGFICDRCRGVSFGFMYFCSQCNIQIDIKCTSDLISLIASKSQNQDQLKDHIERHQQTKLSHFSHPHELLLGYFWPTDTEVGLTDCTACYLPISGPAYCCFECHHFVHESCLWKHPQDIQVPFHPTHTLYPYVDEESWIEKFCPACKSKILEFSYKCSQCDVYLHYKCATSLRRGLTSKFHCHNLYYCQKVEGRLDSNRTSLECGKCKEVCNSEESIYRCIECDINFHLKCAGVAERVKSKCHIHNLILKDRFVEDDSGEYYCDICEEERDPQDEVYFCQECNGSFVAHIECALVQVEKVLEQ